MFSIRDIPRHGLQGTAELYGRCSVPAERRSPVLRVQRCCSTSPAGTAATLKQTFDVFCLGGLWVCWHSEWHCGALRCWGWSGSALHSLSAQLCCGQCCPWLLVSACLEFWRTTFYSRTELAELHLFLFILSLRPRWVLREVWSPLEWLHIHSGGTEVVWWSHLIAQSPASPVLLLQVLHQGAGSSTTQGAAAEHSADPVCCWVLSTGEGSASPAVGTPCCASLWSHHSFFFFTMAVRCFYESILKDSRWFWETETRNRCKWILGVVSEPNRSTGLPKHRFTLWQRECGVFFFLGRSCCSVTALTLLQFLVYVLRWFVTKPSGCICAGNPHGWYSKQLSIFYMCLFLSCNSCEDNCII